MMLFVASVPLALEIVGDIETVPAAPGRTGWRLTGLDPRLLASPARPLPPGRYRFELRGLRHSTHRLAVKLYLDHGDGLSKASMRHLSLSEQQSGQVFETDRPVRGLRIDPHDGPAEMSFDELRLTRVSTTLDRAASVLRLMRGRSPAEMLRLAVRGMGLVRRQGLIAALTTIDRLAMAGHRSASEQDYAAWVQSHDSFTPADLDLLAETARCLPRTPLISVLMPVYNPAAEHLEAAIMSVRSQVYPHWQLCIADDASTKPHVARILEAAARADSRINVVRRERNGHISEATNTALALARGEWLAMLDHDDLLRPHALLEVAREALAHPDALLIYSDEDKLGAHGRRLEPFFKPDFSPELLHGQNYFNHLSAYRTGLVRELGGWRKGFEGSQDYDLNLRVVERARPDQVRHIPKILYHWRAVAGSTAQSSDSKSYAYAAGLRALADHAARSGQGAVAEGLRDWPFYRYRYPVPQPHPMISIIVPTRDAHELIRNCLHSVLTRTLYDNFEILVVDNGTTDARALRYLSDISGDPRVRILRYDAPFNYSAINNFAVGHAKGEYVVLLNNDTVVISPGWLSEMLSLAALPDAGCVGAKLYYGDGRLQHGGVHLGIGGVAGHTHKLAPRSDPGYFGRLTVVHEVSAVTGACLMVRTSTYRELGGLDEDNLAIAFNDVDFCIRVQQSGRRNLWTPFAELYHLESISRGAEDTPEKRRRFTREVEHMIARWGDVLLQDPYYSPNLSLHREDFALAFPPRIHRLADASALAAGSVSSN